jgi:hypothetical protein
MCMYVCNYVRRVYSRGVTVRESVRLEFRKAAHLTDPGEIARQLVVGRDCLMEIQHRVGSLMCLSLMSERVGVVLCTLLC